MAISANLMMFNAIGFPGVTPEVDVIISGIVVGSGTKFTHDVIGIFSQGKQVVEKYKELTESRKDVNKKVVKKEDGEISVTAV